MTSALKEDLVITLVECDCVSEKSYTMDVHVGENHRENIECGLCECTLDDKKKLETHLVTCEVYQCGDSECRERVKKCLT